ncbi:hypothetical protein GBA52_028848 [Prunus armeniaca]|nr:hypothetical protein GBA52_028848 [Prunus armeniaca]
MYSMKESWTFNRYKSFISLKPAPEKYPHVYPIFACEEYGSLFTVSVNGGTQILLMHACSSFLKQE